MLKFIVFVLAIAMTMADPDGPLFMQNFNERLIDGKNQTIQSLPYQVSIHYNYELACSGSILSEDLVITSASCLFNKSSEDVFIRAGSSHFYTGGTIHRVRAIALHPDYAWGYNQYRCDIALVKLIQKFKFDKTRKPIPICESDVLNLNGTAIVSGWGGDGYVPYVFLQSKEVKIVEKEKCAEVYDAGVFDEETQLCVDSPAVCTSDNGGPLVVGDCLAGIVSVFTDCRIIKPDVPGMHTEVSAFCPWINKMTGLDIECRNSTGNATDTSSEYYSID